jgi:hypothetical protein
MIRWAVAILVLVGAAFVVSACDETNSRGAASPGGELGDGGGAGPPAAPAAGGW